MADTRRLPHPVISEWTWQIEGLCRGMDSAVFFHPDGERGSARARRQASAKNVCSGCPVLVRCRTHALNVHEPYGVWGGLSEEERQAVVAQGELAVRASIDKASEIRAGAVRRAGAVLAATSRSADPFGVLTNLGDSRSPVAGS